MDKNIENVQMFDLSVALRKLEHYCRSTAMAAHLIDPEGAILGSYNSLGKSVILDSSLAHGCCSIDRALNAGSYNTKVYSHLYAAYEADRFAGKYIQMCPHSLILWASPIVIADTIRAAYVSEPVLVIESDEIIEELRSHGSMTASNDKTLRAAINALPRATTERVSSLSELLADIAMSIASESPYAARKATLEQHSSIFDFIEDSKKNMESKDKPYPIEKERELLLAISQGSKQEAQKLLNEILGYIFFHNGNEVSTIRTRVMELVVLLSRAALDGGGDIDQVFGMNNASLEQIRKMESIDEIAAWLSVIMIRFTKLVFNLKNVKHVDVMQRAIKYINMHYNEPISLDDVAESVYLSTTYFSRLFNEEMGCRFTAYLNRIRIDKSKLLLRDTKIPLIAISGLVGYEDQSYFTKVFKQLTGVSPGRFRLMGGKPRTSQLEIHEYH